MKRNLLFTALICILLAFVSCNKSDAPSNITLTYNVNLPLDFTYAKVLQKIDLNAITDAFGISYEEFKAGLGVEKTSTVHYYAIKPDGSIDQKAPTYAGYGHWFNTDGKVTTWGATAVLFSQYSEDLGFSIGQFSGATNVGDTYTIKQGFLYNGLLATCIFNITITAAQ